MGFGGTNSHMITSEAPSWVYKENHPNSSYCCSGHLELAVLLSPSSWLMLCWAEVTLKVGGSRLRVTQWFLLVIVCCFWLTFSSSHPFLMLHQEHFSVIKEVFKNMTWMAADHLSSKCAITVCLSDSNCRRLEWMALVKSAACPWERRQVVSPFPVQCPPWPCCVYLGPRCFLNMCLRSNDCHAVTAVCSLHPHKGAMLWMFYTHGRKRHTHSQHGLCRCRRTQRVLLTSKEGEVAELTLITLSETTSLWSLFFLGQIVICLY